MAIGGGYFKTQNKVLPGAYINFISKATAAQGQFDRGIAAFGLELDWGPEQEAVKVTADDFINHSKRLFGYEYEHEKLKGLRDLFANINTLYAYRLDSGGTKAKNDTAEAKYPGTAGNRLKTVILASVDHEGKFEVQTICGTDIVDIQTVKSADELKENDYVTWISGAELTETASSPLTGGTNGAVDGEAHQSFLDAVESCPFHAIGTTSTDETVKQLYVNYQIRMRETVGKKFQTVLYNCAADYEGVVNVKNSIKGDDWPESSMVYFTTGIIAGCKLGESNTNKTYTGEFQVDTKYILESTIEKGEFVYHEERDEIRVLEDINSLVTFTEEKGEVFRHNETIRTIDEIAVAAATMFTNKYRGKIQNNPAGRVSYHTDLCLHHQELERLGAITDFDPKKVEVLPGKRKTDVIVNDEVIVQGMMDCLYMTCVVG